MSAQGIRAGRAYVELGTNDSKLKAGLKAAQQKLKSWGQSLVMSGASLVGAGSAVLAPMLGAASVFASSGDELSKMADKTGASVESLSELRHAASQSAVDFKRLGSAMNKQQRNLAEAASGNKTAQEAFDRLGVSVDDLIKLSPDQQFEVLADRISQIEDPAQRTAAAMEVFGKSGAELMPLMIGGAKGIQTLRNEARNLGLQVSGKDAAAATLLGDTWANVQSVLKDVAFEVGAALAPALTDAMNIVIPFIVGIARWIGENRQLVVTVAGVAAGVVAAGAAMLALGGVFTAGSLAIGAVISAAGTLATVFTAVISPVGIAIGLVAGLTMAFLQWTEAGQAVTSWFATEFNKLTSIVSTTIGGMFNAIKAGKLELAAEIAFTGVKLAIATIMESVLSLFGTSIDDMMAMLAEVMKRIGQVISRLNVARLMASDWLAKQMGKLVGVEVLPEDSQALTDAVASRDAWDAMDTQQAARAWSDALNPDNLKRKLAELNSEAAMSAQESATLDIAKLNFTAAEIDVEGISNAIGTSSAALKSMGTFSAEQAARIGGPTEAIPKQQLEELRSIKKHVKRTAEKRGGVATP